MANLKNITELPVAESADGLNLIVNDNGVAKQIAASEVGAQADWTETNETSASFIKNKPDNILTYDKNNPPAGVDPSGVFTGGIYTVVIKAVTYVTDDGDTTRLELIHGDYDTILRKLFNCEPVIAFVHNLCVVAGVMLDSEASVRRADVSYTELDHAIYISYERGSGMYFDAYLNEDNTLVYDGV
jgi:hypothetical protein